MPNERDSVTLRIALVGDYDAEVTAHRAIPMALRLAATRLGFVIHSEWVATDTISSSEVVDQFDGIWCVPASPYRSMDGALCAIRYAREHGVPFLGTCGGFQHAIVEYARSVLKWDDADHAEDASGTGRMVISPLSCALIESLGDIRLSPGSRLARAYASERAQEGYRCSYGVNELYRHALFAGALRVTAEDGAGDVRGVELDGHPFFVATLFQPERGALGGMVPPIVVAFAQAMVAARL